MAAVTSEHITAEGIVLPALNEVQAMTLDEATKLCDALTEEHPSWPSLILWRLRDEAFETAIVLSDTKARAEFMANVAIYFCDTGTKVFNEVTLEYGHVCEPCGNVYVKLQCIPSAKVTEIVQHRSDFLLHVGDHWEKQCQNVSDPEGLSSKQKKELLLWAACWLEKAKVMKISRSSIQSNGAIRKIVVEQMDRFLRKDTSDPWTDMEVWEAGTNQPKWKEHIGNFWRAKINNFEYHSTADYLLDKAFPYDAERHPQYLPCSIEQMASFVKEENIVPFTDPDKTLALGAKQAVDQVLPAIQALLFQEVVKPDFINQLDYFKNFIN